MPGKNKLVPRLLGITKESVVRMDERTKEVGFYYLPLCYQKDWVNLITLFCCYSS